MTRRRRAPDADITEDENAGFDLADLDPSDLVVDAAPPAEASWDGRLSAKRPGYSVSDLMHLLREAIGDRFDLVNSLFVKYDIDSSTELDVGSTSDGFGWEAAYGA